MIERFGKKSSRSFHFKFNTKSPSTLKRLPTFDKFPYFDDFNVTQVWLHTDFKNPDDQLQFNILNNNIYVSVPELIEMFGTEQVIRLLEESVSIIKEIEKIRMELDRIGTKAFFFYYFKWNRYTKIKESVSNHSPFSLEIQQGMPMFVSKLSINKNILN